MKQQYQVTFSKNGYIVNTCIQVAESEKEAIEIARMYHPVGKAKGRAVPVSEIAESEE